MTIKKSNWFSSNPAPDTTSSVKAIIIDGAMIAQMLVSGTSETFSHYISCVSSIYSVPAGQCNKAGCSLGCLLFDSLTASTQENREVDEDTIYIFYSHQVEKLSSSR